MSSTRETFSTKDYLRKGVAAATIGLSALSLAACNERGVGAVPVAEQPTAVESVDTVPPGTAEPSVTTTSGTTPVAEIPTTSPSGIETTEPAPIDQPIVVDGPFGEEYPAFHQEALIPQTSIQEMDAMDLYEFGKLPIADRIDYLMTKVAEGEGTYYYFKENENVIPVFIPDQWSKTRAGAFYKGATPEECAKLAIADRYYAVNPGELEISEATRITGESMREACENKTSTSNWIPAYSFTGVETMREKTIDGYGAPATISTINYDVQEDGQVVKGLTTQAVELTVRLSSGINAVVFATGYDVK